ncbi:tRNA3(Ser)-specific nuclease WapA precursor [Enhygromyxa salina]|uniref:tRNA3(Ser)-specific nuclease WapA n=1 Tax=Enhygromyxa salina TaxID=215803 RepID=A0A2S9YNF7_9BACT|nr:tRNA3(Ser)-specific nuclease WapA precursor [Enhygromyxa salina]
MHLDTLGRPLLSVAHNKDLVGVDEYYTTKSVLDIQGHVLEVIDARDNTAESRTFGMLGQSLVVSSEDAGDRWSLLNALGQPMRNWDSRSQRFSYSYDTLRRPVDRTVSVSGGSQKLLGRIVYGDLLSSPENTNHVGRVYRVYDGAGVATTVEFDFKGNPLEEQRQLVTSKTTQPDWSALLGQSTIAAMATAATSLLDSETFSASSQRDAVNRVLTAISPDDSEVSYTYDEGGALQAVEVKHRGSSTAETVVGDITYNARGQRESVVYGSTSSPTTTTNYTYDPQTYRLASLSTVRGSDAANLQGLHYHYDPVGNITDIRDSAQQTVYFNNSVVAAANSYTYDAAYRLIEATGREHSTQGTTQRTDVQITPGPQPMTSDPSAMRRYTQKFTYDEVGNILKMQHIPASGSGWTRYYESDEYGNRLEKTSAPGDPANGPYTHAYTYDAHGNMTAMPHLSSMVWNHDDELREVTVGTETVYFQYAGGMRSRKYVEKAGAITEERIYLGPFEIYRKRKRISGTLDLERESLHISDDTGRICIIETKTVDGGSAVGSPTGIWRYQLSNHLGSAATEVDGSGAVISYEEYHPYGASAYRAVNASIDVSAKRYRYTGMERDEETGLAYHSARYYAPWLGMWMGADPIGLGDGANRYAYAGDRPASSVDRNGREEGRLTGILLDAFRRPEVTGGGDGDPDVSITLRQEINEWATPELEQAFVETALADYEVHLRAVDEQSRAQYARAVDAPSNVLGLHPAGRYDALFDPLYPGSSRGDHLVQGLRGEMAVIQGELRDGTPADRILRYHATYAEAIQSIPQPLVEQAIGVELGAVAFAAGTAVGLGVARPADSITAAAARGGPKTLDLFGGKNPKSLGQRTSTWLLKKESGPPQHRFPSRLDL